MTSPPKIEIAASPLAMLTGVVMGLSLTAFSGAMAFRLSNDIKAGSLPEFMGYVGLVVFGFGTGYCLWRMVTTKGPVVTLTDTGIRDTRIAAEEIPWACVHTMSTWKVQHQNILVFAIDPAVEANLTLTRMARWSRESNKRLGADGLCVAARGIKIDHFALAQMCSERIMQARAEKLASGKSAATANPV